MNTIKASEFKAHFGNTLDSSEQAPVRIRRRGRPSTILISETAYTELQERANRPSAEGQQALKRLRNLSSKPNALQEPDARAHAILSKHLGDRG